MAPVFSVMLSPSPGATEPSEAGREGAGLWVGGMGSVLFFCSVRIELEWILILDHGNE